MHYHFVKAQLSGNSICGWKHKSRRDSSHYNILVTKWNYWQWIPTKCIEVHFNQRLILGEWSWSLHRATENVATVPVCKTKKGVYKNLLSPWMQWIRQKLIVYTEVQVLLWKPQPLECPLTWGKEVQLSGFSVHSCVAHGLCLCL